MGSRFDDDYLASAWPVLQDVHGEPVTITPKGDVTGGTEVMGVVEFGVVEGQSLDDGRETHDSGTLLVAIDAVADWTPGDGDTFQIGDSLYAYKRTIQKNPLFMIEFLKIDQRRYGGSDAYKR